MKNFLIVLFVVVFIFGGFVFYTQANEIIPICRAVSSFSDLQGNGMGDAKNDGILNSFDVDYLREYSVGLNNTCGANAENNCFCDINADEKISTLDAILLELYLKNSEGKWRLNIENGSGDGIYPVGKEVEIIADTPPAGQQFKEWIGGDEKIANVNDSSTTITMPEANIDLIATYENIPVSVSNNRERSSSGSYKRPVLVTPPVVGEVLGVEDYVFTLLLKKGSTGNEVMELQKFLNGAGYNCGVVDGLFGLKTKLAVENFQRMNPPLAIDGIVGLQTRSILNK